MEDAREEIKARLSVEDVIGQYIELKRAGRTFKGFSPWSNERTPSFMVSPEKGIWKDFSSGHGGDIFSFVMAMEGIDFREALEKLARQAGVELKRFDGDKRVADRKKRMREALELATKYFQLALSKNKRIIDYVFNRRDLNRGTVERFRIGYAPSPKGGRVLGDFLRGRGFSEEELQDAGLVNRYGGDLFKGRMTVPLMDSLGAVIGFTGRIIEDAPDAPKYLNTPETFLYNKSRHIFGLSQAKDAIRKKKYAVVVEGNMDVISSHQAGVMTAVATAGTAMTVEHLKALSKLTSDIRLAYDGDSAGVAAAERAILLAGDLGINLSVVSEYQGCKDADELIHKKGAEAWVEAIESARPAVDWLLEKYEENSDIRTARGKKEYSSVAVQLIKTLKDPVEKEHYERMVAEKLEISLEALRDKEGDLLKKETEAAVKKQRMRRKHVDLRGEKIDEIGKLELFVLAILAGVPKFREDFTTDDFWSDEGQKMISKGFEVDKKDEALYTFLQELLLTYEGKYAGWNLEDLAEEIRGLTAKMKKEKNKRQINELQVELREAEDADDEKQVEEILKKLDKIMGN
jgi:DNA primase